MDADLPGGPIANRPLYFTFLADCSTSMSGEKIQSLNHAIREAIPPMRGAAESNPNAKVLVRAIKFSAGAHWHVMEPTDVAEFEWEDLTANGPTEYGPRIAVGGGGT